MDWEKRIAEAKRHVINAGAIHDIRIDLNNRMESGSLTIEYLRDEIELEKSKRNRITIIKLLKSAIRKLEKI